MLRRVMVFIGVALIVAQVGPAFAANPDTGPGCGLGKLAWADFKNQKNIAPQVMMATTNATGICPCAGAMRAAGFGPAVSTLADASATGNVNSIPASKANGSARAELRDMATLLIDGRILDLARAV